MQGREHGEGKSMSETGLGSLGQGSRIRARNGEGWAGSRCGVLETETKVCGRVGYAVEAFRMSWGVKWQNTTWSWSGERELMEGTWLQLMCCAPSRSCCPKFRSNGIHGVYDWYSGVYRRRRRRRSRLEVAQMGALWSIYELILSYMTCSYVYPWE